MAEIRPFVSIRPQRGKAAEIAALPYDVYNREEATKEVERHPQSFLSIDRAETQFPLSVDMYDDKVYERAHDTLWQWVENGTFLTEDKKCYYLYELTMNGRVQTGVAACASIDDYENGIIKKHENTRAERSTASAMWMSVTHRPDRSFWRTARMKGSGVSWKRRSRESRNMISHRRTA